MRGARYWFLIADLLEDLRDCFSGVSNPSFSYLPPCPFPRFVTILSSYVMLAFSLLRSIYLLLGLASLL